MPEHPKLLRKPLPPKILPSLSVLNSSENKPLDLHSGRETRTVTSCAPDSAPELQYYYPKGHKCVLHGIKNELPAQIVRNFVIPFIPSGPDGLPLRKRCIYPPQVHLLEVLQDDPRYASKPKFSLDDFLAKPSLYPSPAEEELKKAVLSRHNYKKLVELFTAELQKNSQTKVNILLLSSDDIPVASTRIPPRHLILEIAALVREHMKSLTLMECNAVEERAGNLDGAGAGWTTDRWKLIEEGNSFPEYTGAETILNSVTSRYFQGSRRTRSPFKYDEETEMITPSELAILDSLVQGGVVLSLKAHFILQVPDLTPLLHTLRYLNLSFNDLQHIPVELYDIQNLEVLKLRNNPVKEIPLGIHRLGKLRTFVISFCLLSTLPLGLFHLPCLQFLDVSYNSISSIPDDIRRLRALEFLNVEGNELAALPCGALQLPLKQLRVQNNFMHPLFWRVNTQNQPQRLTDLAALAFSKCNLLHCYSEIPNAAQEILFSTVSGTCDCCKGPLYGQGLRLIRHCGKIFGIRQLPFMFYACSPSCYEAFMSQTKNLHGIIYGD